MHIVHNHPSKSPFNTEKEGIIWDYVYLLGWCMCACVCQPFRLAMDRGEEAKNTQRPGPVAVLCLRDQQKMWVTGAFGDGPKSKSQILSTTPPEKALEEKLHKQKHKKKTEKCQP